MKVYLVGDHGPEHNFVISVHKTMGGALKAFQARRLKLLEEAKEGLKREADGCMKEMYEEIVTKLSETNPDKIDNYPQETPYIREMDVLE